ncbi:MAG TPA: uroporphyrinogen decarboxylase family protein, partial [Spirochaetota bacterium]|nr:uroporphyrinogen decarboxylase family protein [Spirochaetota bacterium]
DNISYRHKPVLPDLNDVDKYPYPDAADPVWYEDLDQAIAAYGATNAVISMFPAVLHTMDLFRHYDRFFLDVIDNPLETEKLLENCTRVLETVVDNITHRDIAYIVIGDDISTESSLLASPAFLDKYVFKYNQRLVDIAKKNNKKVFFHTDGVLPYNIVDRLIDMGFDGIHPMQPTCNNMHEFARRYADKLLFYGWLDNTHTVPEKGLSAIEDHIREIFDTFGNRVIISSSDFMQGTPWETILKLPEIIDRVCRF